MTPPDRERLLKVRLHSQELDSEWCWAEDCGPAPGPDGARYVRLANVPFLHPKPTWGDVIVVTLDQDGLPAWDREGASGAEIDDLLIEDGGRWSLFVDFELLDPRGDVEKAFQALHAAGEERDIAVEGLVAPRDGHPGKAILAVPGSMDVDDVMAYLEARELPLSLTVVEPREEDEGVG
jgi:hypothetical protein